MRTSTPLILILLVASHLLLGQSTIDYNKIILPDHITSPDFAEKLVQIAWRNNPLNEMARQDVAKSKIDVKIYNADWLNFLNFQVNLNEFTLNPSADTYDRAAYYPKYNLGLRFNFGNLLTVPFQVQKSKHQEIYMDSQLNVAKLETRKMVMKAYNEFLMKEKVYKIQSLVLSDTESYHKLVEQKFKNGENTYEVFSNSQSNFSKVSLAFLESERDYKNAKLDLEALIGLRLEDVR